MKTFWLICIPLLLTFPVDAQICRKTRPHDSIVIFTSLQDALQAPEEVRRLHLKKQKLTSIPPEVFLLTNLIELDLSGNRIEVIPDEMGLLHQLRVLSMEKNRIHTVSDSIGSLSHLEVLILNRNHIARIPAAIARLNRLTCLELWKNEIGSLPEEIGLLKESLRYIDLHYNPFPPGELVMLKGLLPATNIRTSRNCACTPE